MAKKRGHHKIRRRHFRIILLIFIILIFLGGFLVLKLSNIGEYSFNKYLKKYNEIKTELKIKYYEMLINKYPNNYQNYYNLGWLYYKSNNYDKAIHYFNNSIQLNKSFSNGYIGLAWAYTIGHNLEWPIIRDKSHDKSYYQSFIFFNRALEINPNSDKAYAGLGYTLLLLGSTNRSMDYLFKAIEKNQMNDITYEFLGWAYYFKGERESAMKNFIKANEINPLNSDALYGIGRMYSLKMGNCPSDSRQHAIEYFKKSIAADPSFVESYNGLGWAFYSNGDYSKAIKYFKEALTLKPDHYLSLVGLGRTYLEMDNKEESLRLLNKAKSLRPNYKEANEALSRIYPNADVDKILNDPSAPRACPFSASIPYKLKN